jgi:hypothetical protein
MNIKDSILRIINNYFCGMEFSYLDIQDHLSSSVSKAQINACLNVLMKDKKIQPSRVLDLKDQTIRMFIRCEDINKSFKEVNSYGYEEYLKFKENHTIFISNKEYNDFMNWKKSMCCI